VVEAMRELTVHGRVHRNPRGFAITDNKQLAL
jgi:hypothetical protein